MREPARARHASACSSFLSLLEELFSFLFGEKARDYKEEAACHAFGEGVESAEARLVKRWRWAGSEQAAELRA